MNNKFGDGKIVNLTNALAAGSASGGVVVQGLITGIATQTHAYLAELPCELEGVFDLSVTDTGGGIAKGDQINCTLSSGALSDASVSGTTVVKFGFAMEAVTASATATIKVLKVMP